MSRVLNAPSVIVFLCWLSCTILIEGMACSQLLHSLRLGNESFGWEMQFTSASGSGPKNPKVDQPWLLPSSWMSPKTRATGFTIARLPRYGQSPICRLNMIELFGKHPCFFLCFSHNYESSMSFLAKGSWHFDVPHQLARFAGLFWLCRVGGRAGKLNGRLGWICGKTRVASSRWKWIYPLVI